MSEKINRFEGTGPAGRKFRKLDTVSNYDGLTDNEIERAVALIGAGTEAKVEFIFELMSTLRFQTHRTAKELSYAWNLNINTVRGYCARAKDIFNFMAQHERSPDAYRQEIQLRYEHLTNMALQAEKPMLKTDKETGEQEIVYAKAPDIKAAITATKAIAELQAAHRNAVVEANRNQYTERDLSLEQLSELMKEELNETEHMENAQDSERPGGSSD